MDSSLKQILAIIFFSTLLVMLVVVALKALGLEDKYLAFLLWAQGSGFRGMLLTAVLLLISVVFLLPSMHLTTGAGLLFGVTQGAIIVVVAETIGALVAYAIGKRALPDSIHQRLVSSKLFTTVDTLVGKGGWEIVAATRMVPFFPFKASNYIFGITSVKPADYTKGTFLGLWPITLFNVYLGSIAADVMSLADGAAQRTRFEWIVYATGFILVLIVLLITARLAAKRLKSP